MGTGKIRPVARRLIDDVYDVLEGSLAGMLRSQNVTDHMDMLVLQSRVREVRGAVAALSALLRDGHAWRPAEDGHEATEWRTHVLAALDTPASMFLAHVTRELDELVTLATATGPRRPLPAGSFERLARAAGVRRTVCMTGPRQAGDDHAKGWATIESYETLSRVGLALGLTLADLARAAATLVRTRAEGEAAQLLDLALAGEAIAPERRGQFTKSLDTDTASAAFYALEALERPGLLRVDSAFHYAVTLHSIDALRERLTTPAIRERLAHPERN